MMWLLLAAIVVGVTVSLIPGYETWAMRLTRENGVLETLTVVCYLFAVIVILKLVIPLFVREEPKGLYRWWLSVLALGFIFIAGEETNWGDIYFHYQAGEFIRNVNAQHNLSLHNIALPVIGTYWVNDLSHIIAICGGMLLPFFIWASNFFRRYMLVFEVPLPPWISQAYFFVAAIIPPDNVIELQRANIPSELREVTIAMGTAIWFWCLNQNRHKLTAAQKK